MKRTLVLFSFCLFAGLGANAQVSNNNEDEVYKIDRHGAQGYVAGEVLVKMKDVAPVTVRRVKGKFQATDNNSLNAVLDEFGIEEMEQVLPGEKRRTHLRRAKAPDGGIIQERDLSQLYRVRMAQPDMMKTRRLVQRLEALSEVEFAEPNYKTYIMANADYGETIAPTPGQNPQYTLQWGIPEMKINELWTKPIVNATRPVIAILDTGVDTTHPDLAANCVAGYDFINETTEVRDFNMHGTHVAGIAAACDNGIGIIGANPRALIMPVTVMQSDGTGDMATLIRGINFASQNGATVINMSLGSYANSKALRQALGRAYQSCVIVAAAGNDHHGIYPEPHYCSLASKHCKYCVPSFPAAYSFVLGVQATRDGGGLAGFSNFDCDGPSFTTAQDPYGDEGFNYEMKAPGVNILSTVPNGGYRQLNGTSMAAPLVAGAISALMMVKQYESQEVLWADLLHTNDFLDAYEVTDRPAELELLGLQFDDRLELVEGENHTESDGRIDAGETIKLYPVLRTTWGEASNIKLHLEVAEFEDASVVTITTPDADFGYHLSAYGKNVSVNPLVFKTKGNVTHGRHIRLKLTASCDGTGNAMEHEFTITVDNMTKIGGMVKKDMTLTADKKYLVTSGLAIPEGITLTIEPGTTVVFSKNTGISATGHLIAHGTPKKPIIFTGSSDQYWSGIFKESSTDTIEYAIYDHVYTEIESAVVLKNCILNNQLVALPTYCYNCNIVDSGGGGFLDLYRLGGETNNIVNNIIGPDRRTRIFPWQPTQTMHDRIN